MSGIVIAILLILVIIMIAVACWGKKKEMFCTCTPLGLKSGEVVYPLWGQGRNYWGWPNGLDAIYAQ